MAAIRLSEASLKYLQENRKKPSSMSRVSAHQPFISVVHDEESEDEDAEDFVASLVMTPRLKEHAKRMENLQGVRALNLESRFRRDPLDHHPSNKVMETALASAPHDVESPTGGANFSGLSQGTLEEQSFKQPNLKPTREKVAAEQTSRGRRAKLDAADNRDNPSVENVVSPYKKPRGRPPTKGRRQTTTETRDSDVVNPSSAPTVPRRRPRKKNAENPDGDHTENADHLPVPSKGKTARSRKNPTNTAPETAEAPSAPQAPAVTRRGRGRQKNAPNPAQELAVAPSVAPAKNSKQLKQQSIQASLVSADTSSTVDADVIASKKTAPTSRGTGRRKNRENEQLQPDDEFADEPSPKRHIANASKAEGKHVDALNVEEQVFEFMDTDAEDEDEESDSQSTKMVKHYASPTKRRKQDRRNKYEEREYSELQAVSPLRSSAASKNDQKKVAVKNSTKPSVSTRETSRETYYSDASDDDTNEHNHSTDKRWERSRTKNYFSLLDETSEEEPYVSEDDGPLFALANYGTKTEQISVDVKKRPPAADVTGESSQEEEELTAAPPTAKSVGYQPTLSKSHGSSTYGSSPPNKNRKSTAVIAKGASEEDEDFSEDEPSVSPPAMKVVARQGNKPTKSPTGRAKRPASRKEPIPVEDAVSPSYDTRARSTLSTNPSARPQARENPPIKAQLASPVRQRRSNRISEQVQQAQTLERATVDFQDDAIPQMSWADRSSPSRRMVGAILATPTKIVKKAPPANAQQKEVHFSIETSTHKIAGISALVTSPRTNPPSTPIRHPPAIANGTPLTSRIRLSVPEVARNSDGESRGSLKRKSSTSALPSPSAHKRSKNPLDPGHRVDQENVVALSSSTQHQMEHTTKEPCAASHEIPALPMSPGTRFNPYRAAMGDPIMARTLMSTNDYRVEWLYLQPECSIPIWVSSPTMITLIAGNVTLKSKNKKDIDIGGSSRVLDLKPDALYHAVNTGDIVSIFQITENLK